MKRANWELELGNFLISNMHRDFRWGEWDCVTFASECVRIQTGTDLKSEIMGNRKYSSLVGGVRFLKSIGGDIPSILDEHLERAESDVRTGDIAMMAVEERFSLGVVVGNMAWFLDTEGMRQAPVHLAEGVWHVGT